MLFSGISGKSQILFALVYTTRYLDLISSYVSMYNTFMKFIFLATSYATIYLIYLKFKATYDHNHDTFRIEFLVIPAFALSMLINHDFTFLEVIQLICEIATPKDVFFVGFMDIQYLFGICCNFTSIVYG